MNPFEFAEPESLEEAVQLLTEESSGAEVIAGGTDLLSELKDGLRKPRRLVSLAGIEELDGVLGRRTGSGWVLQSPGALGRR